MSLAEWSYLAGRTAMVALCLLGFVLALRGRPWQAGRPDRLALAMLLLFGAGLAVFDALDNLDWRADVPISPASWAWFAFDLGAPVLALWVLRLARQRDRMLADLAALAVTDPLTGLPNRRGFEGRAAQAIAQAHRAGAPCAVLALDLDRFKRINDGHGHGAGDAVLRALGDALRAELREGDLPARLGGEEFAVLLPATGTEEAAALAERLRLAVPRLVPHPDPASRVTLSIGLAPLGPEGLGEALARADAALYGAKRKGRDRVERAAPALQDARE